MLKDEEDDDNKGVKHVEDEKVFKLLTVEPFSLQL
jgi:hypothetical protein